MIDFRRRLRSRLRRDATRFRMTSVSRYLRSFYCTTGNVKMYALAEFELPEIVESLMRIGKTTD